jgi:hypothetical protein
VKTAQERELCIFAWMVFMIFFFFFFFFFFVRFGFFLFLFLFFFLIDYVALKLVRGDLNPLFAEGHEKEAEGVRV